MLFADFVEHLFKGGKVLVYPGAHVVASTTIADPTGDPLNEVVRLGWRDPSGISHAVAFTEQGVIDAVSSADGKIIATDAEGDTTILFIEAKRTQPDATAVQSHALQVSLDGGITYLPATQGVRVVYNRLDLPGEDELGQMHVNLTSEGVIYDLWVTRDPEDPLGHNIGTANAPIADLIGDMVAEAA